MDVFVSIVLITLIIGSALINSIYLFLFFLTVLAIAEITRLHQKQEQRDKQLIKSIHALIKTQSKKSQ